MAAASTGFDRVVARVRGEQPDLVQATTQAYSDSGDVEGQRVTYSACLVGWFVSLLVHEEVPLTGLCERKIWFQLKIYDRLRQATAKRTG